MQISSFFKNLSSDQRRVALVILLNIIIVIIESTVGVISGSLALLSDAWHNLSDVLALVVTAIALGLGARAATPAMTYGYVRSEMMATFINAGFLSLLMIWVAVEAVDRLITSDARRRMAHYDYCRNCTDRQYCQCRDLGWTCSCTYP